MTRKILRPIIDIENSRIATKVMLEKIGLIKHIDVNVTSVLALIRDFI